MLNTTGISRWVTILALMVASVGVVVTYNGVGDLRIVFATVLSISWLSVSMLAYYKRSTLQRIQALERSDAADPPE